MASSPTSPPAASQLRDVTRTEPRPVFGIYDANDRWLSEMPGNCFEKMSSSSALSTTISHGPFSQLEYILLWVVPARQLEPLGNVLIGLTEARRRAGMHPEDPCVRGTLSDVVCVLDRDLRFPGPTGEPTSSREREVLPDTAEADESSATAWARECASHPLRDGRARDEVGIARERDCREWSDGRSDGRRRGEMEVVRAPARRDHASDDFPASEWGIERHGIHTGQGREHILAEKRPVGRAQTLILIDSLYLERIG